MNITHIAAICHEANRVLCLAHGDTSQPDWFSAPDWQRESAIAGVQFHMQHQGKPASPEDSHEAWRKHKAADGWTYGELKNSEAKTHPCMVPFDELPPHQQAKDHLFRSICSALVPFLPKAEAVAEAAESESSVAPADADASSSEQQAAGESVDQSVDDPVDAPAPAAAPEAPSPVPAPAPKAATAKKTTGKRSKSAA